MHKDPKEDNNIEILVNIDGLPLYRSSSKSVWPILCAFDHTNVFITCLYFGSQKPVPVEDFLQDFLNERKEVSCNGVVVDGRLYNVSIKAILCDAPARAFLKGIVYHTGYYSCERCTIKGSYDGRVVFNDFQSELCMRSEDVFNNFGYPNHQRSLSPLIDAGISCIHGFDLYLITCTYVMLGVVKRLLKALVQSGSKAKLSVNQKETIFLIHDFIERISPL